MSAKHTQNGFTLIELVMTISILAIISGLATPIFDAYSASQAVQNQARDLVSILEKAKNYAETSVTQNFGTNVSTVPIAYGVEIDNCNADEEGCTYEPIATLVALQEDTEVPYDSTWGFDAIEKIEIETISFNNKITLARITNNEPIEINEEDMNQYMLKDEESAACQQINEQLTGTACKTIFLRFDTPNGKISLGHSLSSGFKNIQGSLHFTIQSRANSDRSTVVKINQATEKIYVEST